MEILMCTRTDWQCIGPNLRWRARTHTELPSPTTRQEPDTDEMEPLKCKGVPMAGMFIADRALSRG